jgi:hypothetical protein
VGSPTSPLCAGFGTDFGEKLLVTEMGFWRSCVRKALEDKVWNEEIREG